KFDYDKFDYDKSDNIEPEKNIIENKPEIRNTHEKSKTGKNQEIAKNQKIGGKLETLKIKETFESLLEASFKNQNLTRMMEEKRKLGKARRKRMDVKQKIKTSYPKPQTQLDLHGCTAAKARHKTRSFIKNALDKRILTIRIIVGKGLHSQGRAVLPDVVEDILITLKRENMVLDYQWEKRVKSKSGSVIVYLC
ncbi:Smr/MutS family protein, partial [Desulfobacterales bacterium HSG16]|nr:Smr/MutS family protein [Desulfobacterales bacterium HSG16]